MFKVKVALGGSSDSGSDSKSSGRIMNGRKLKWDRGYVAIWRHIAGDDKAGMADWNILRRHEDIHGEPDRFGRSDCCDCRGSRLRFLHVRDFHSGEIDRQVFYSGLQARCIHNNGAPDRFYGFVSAGRARPVFMCRTLMARMSPRILATSDGHKSFP